MSLIRDLYGRFRHLGAEGLKFCVVGGIGFVVQILIQDTLHIGLGVGPLKANTLGTVAGIVATFVGNRYWTYAHKKSHGNAFFRETRQFLLWAFLGWGIQDGLLAAGTYGLGWTSGIAYTLLTCFGVGVATVVRFWAYRTLVFVGGEQLPPVTAEQLEPETLA